MVKNEAGYSLVELIIVVIFLSIFAAVAVPRLNFAVISKQKAEPAQKNKTSLMSATEHKPDSLYRTLGIFPTPNVNPAKLKSRPSRREPREYVSYADFEGHLDSMTHQEAVKELQREAAFVRILGSYPQTA